MGTKVQANAFLPECRSLVDLNGNPSTATSSTYSENHIIKNGHRLDSLTSRIFKDGYAGCDIEKVRQTILKHESIFRNQLQELHRVYRRQRELMNEMRRELNKDFGKKVNNQMKSFFSPVASEGAETTLNAPQSFSLQGLTGCLFITGTSNVEKQIQESFSKFPGVQNTPRNRKHQASYDADAKLSSSAVLTPQCDSDALGSNFYLIRSHDPTDLNISNPADRNPGGIQLARGDEFANSCSTLQLTLRDFFQDPPDGMNGAISLSNLGPTNERGGREYPSDNYIEKRSFDEHSSIGGFCSGKAMPAEPRNILSNSPPDGKLVHQRKRIIFGVEISEGNDGSCNAAPIPSSATPKHDKINSEPSYSSPSAGLTFIKGTSHCVESDLGKCCKNLDDMKVELEGLNNSGRVHNTVPLNSLGFADCQSKSDNLKGGLPWFLKNPENSERKSTVMKSSYFMNMKSLQNCSQNFFRKDGAANGLYRTLKQKKIKLADGHDVECRTNKANNGTVAKKILGFPISDMLHSSNGVNSGESPSYINCYGVDNDKAREAKRDEKVPRNGLETKDSYNQNGQDSLMSDLRHHIDLNLSLDEKDAPSVPTLPTAIVKIATTEIDLEAPAVIDSEAEASPYESEEKTEMSIEESDKFAAEAIVAISSSGGTGEPPNDTFSDCLKWFADLIYSQQTNLNEADDEEKSIPDGMDYFECMTLKLIETKEEQYYYRPITLNNPSDEELIGATTSRRSRRGQSRRGRQRKDFQRDILPGLVTLSRYEVMEDLKAFEQILKPKGSWHFSQRNGARNGRGKKRLGHPSTPPAADAPFSTPSLHPISCELQFEERSFTGWGKRTRRLPRQICYGSLLSFTVKC